MERVKLYSGGRCRGEITLTDEGGRTRVAARMADPGDGLYRAALKGDGGRQLLLGVMEPAEGELRVCRRPYSRDVAALGAPLRGEAWRSFSFQEPAWQETDRPGQLFQDRFLQSRLARTKRAWWRREREALWLAVPLEEGKPFPLEALFCLARVMEVEGRQCAVFAFRGETPVLPRRPGEA